MSIWLGRSLKCSVMRQGRYLMTTLCMLVASTVVEAQQKQKLVKPERIYTVVDQQPEFPGGQAVMYAWLGKHIKVPNSTIGNLSSTKIFVSFTVDRQGRVLDVRSAKLTMVLNTYRGVEQASSTERNIIQVIQKMPRWMPGSYKGKRVSVRYTLPINLEYE